MSSYKLIEDTSYNIEVWVDGQYINCYSTIDEATDWVEGVSEEDDEITIEYQGAHTTNEYIIVDDCGTWVHH